MHLRRCAESCGRAARSHKKKDGALEVGTWSIDTCFTRAIITGEGDISREEGGGTALGVLL